MFETKGEIAQWRMVYDNVRELEVDEMISIEDLELLYPAARTQRGPVQRAIRELEELHAKTLVPVRGKGYRVAHAREHADLAKRKHRSARRVMKRAVSKARSGDRSQLTPAERQRLDQIEMNLATQAAFMGRVEKRVVRVEQRQVTTDARVDVIMATLARNGIELPAPTDAPHDLDAARA